jgi:sugar phosphate isomerase/epimerase
LRTARRCGWDAAVLQRSSPRIGTTSFVFPAGWLENVRRLAGRVEDVEILLFERPGPSGSCDRIGTGLSPAEVDEIAALGRAHGMTFSVHAPLDLALAAEDPATRVSGVEAALRIAALTAPLAPHALVLHLDDPPEPAGAAQVLAWQARAASSLRALLDGGLSPRLLCVENLGAGLGPAEPLVEELGLSVALDVGHLARDGVSFEAMLARHLSRTRLVHWHGTDRTGGAGRSSAPPGPPLATGQAHPPAPLLAQDHRSLRHYPAAAAVRLLRELERAGWAGVLTIEVFREDDLEESLEVLSGWRREAREDACAIGG